MAFGAFANTGPAEQADAGRRRKSYVALFLLLPGVIYLALTFVAPLLAARRDRVQGAGRHLRHRRVRLRVPLGELHRGVRDLRRDHRAHLRLRGPRDVLRADHQLPARLLHRRQAARYPLWQALALILVIAPFFISFLLRTLAWKQIFSDEGGRRHVAAGAVAAARSDAHITGTPFMVIFGLTYNFIPFMCLPIYASLERLDLRYVEAGSDLYAPPTQRFLRIILPLSLPGVISGSAAGLHPGLRRLHQRGEGVPRQHADDDGRQRHQRPVLPELLPGLGGDVDHPDGDHAHPGRRSTCARSGSEELL